MQPTTVKQPVRHPGHSSWYTWNFWRGGSHKGPTQYLARSRKRKAEEAAALAAAPVKKKAKMNAKLLSFGEDPEDAADLEPPEQHRRIRSAHDVSLTRHPQILL